MAALSARDASVLHRFEVFCECEGITSSTVLHDSAVLEAFLAISCSHLAPHSRGTYRSTLARLGGVVTASEFPGSNAAPPYGQRELAALSSIVRHQSSPARVKNATVLLAAMVGAGLRPREVAQLRPRDLTRGHEEVRLFVRGIHPRMIAVLPPYDDSLWRVASSRSGFLFRPGASVRSTKNLVGEICASLTLDPGDVAFHSARARSTFLCHHLAKGTPLEKLCELAGLHDVESLLRYALHVEGAPQSKADLRARVRAE